MPMVNGTWVPLISQNLLKKTHPFDVGKPKIKSKVQGWWVNVNSPSYVSHPNMQYLGAKWNHLMSCFCSNSHVPTKLFYVCHIFVWLCNLSFVGPNVVLQCLWHA
jgi:hypothetical protein